MKRAALVFAAVAALSPYVAAWPIFRQIGLAPRGVGIEEWSTRVVWLTLFAGLALLVWSFDRWLASAIALSGLSPWRFDLWDAWVLIFAFGCAAVVVIREGGDDRLLTWLGWAGVLQSLILLQQKIGFDLLWNMLHRSDDVRLSGTFGNPGSAAVFAVIAGLCAPMWAVVLIVGPAVSITGQRGAILALIVGVTIRVLPEWTPAILGAGLVALVYGLWALPSGNLRWQVWSAALQYHTSDWWAFGIGFNGWAELARVMRTGSRWPGWEGNAVLWTPAHNDLVQWVIETGVAGLAVLVGFLAHAWRMIYHPRAGAPLAASALISLIWFPMHLIPCALAVIVLVGIGTQHKATWMVA